MEYSKEELTEIIEEIDDIIAECSELNDIEKEDSKEFITAVKELRERFNTFENLPSNEQADLVEEAQALFFSLSIFGDLDGDDDDLTDLEDFTDFDDDFDEDYDDSFEDLDFENIDTEMLSLFEKIASNMEKIDENILVENGGEISEELQELIRSISNDLPIDIDEMRKFESKIADLSAQESPSKVIPISED